MTENRQIDLPSILWYFILLLYSTMRHKTGHPHMETTSKFAKNSRTQTKVLIVDLNNLPTFPTLSIGLLVASLRHADFNTKVLLPLAHDAPAAERERK